MDWRSDYAKSATNEVVTKMIEFRTRAKITGACFTGADLAKRKAANESSSIVTIRVSQIRRLNQTSGVARHAAQSPAPEMAASSDEIVVKTTRSVRRDILVVTR